jgi:hypothetical protein
MQNGYCVMVVWAAARSAIATPLTARNAKEMLRIKTILLRNEFHPLMGSVWNAVWTVYAETGNQRCKRSKGLPANGAAPCTFDSYTLDLRKNGTEMRVREKIKAPFRIH